MHERFLSISNEFLLVWFNKFFISRRIIATGASGGLGSAWAGVSHGAQTRALFELHKSEVVYMLVGQQGQNACKKVSLQHILKINMYKLQIISNVHIHLKSFLSKNATV